jgi:hypothetical protein
VLIGARTAVFVCITYVVHSVGWRSWRIVCIARGASG